MKYTHIKCETLEQNKHVQELLTNQGYEVGTLAVDQSLNIMVDQQIKKYGSWVINTYPYHTTHLTYQEFTMQKLKDLIKQAKKQGISQSALSVKLGHSATYLSTMKAQGISTSLQIELESRISDILKEPNREQLKEENAKLSDLVKSSDKARSNLESRIDRMYEDNTRISRANALIKTGYTKLEEENKALNKRVDLLQDEAKELSTENHRLSKTYTKLEEANKFLRLANDVLKDSIKSKSDAYDNLSKEYAQLAEVSRDQDETISKLQHIVDTQASTIIKQQHQLSESLKTVLHWKTEAEKSKEHKAELSQTIDKLKAEADASNTSIWMLWGALFMAAIVACILAI